MITCKQRQILGEMADGNWEVIVESLTDLAEDAPKSSLTLCGKRFAKGMMKNAINYLKTNEGVPKEELLKLDRVNEIIETLAFYVEMQSFAAGLHTIDLAIRVGHLENVKKCKEGSVKKLSRNEVMALMHGIAKKDVNLKNRTLNGEIVKALIERGWFTHLQILEAMTKAEMIAESPQTTIRVVVVETISILS